MIQIYKTEEEVLNTVDTVTDGCWINVTNPTAEEIKRIAEITGVDPDDLRAPLDEEERSRTEVIDDYILILVDVPTLDERDRYITIPLGIYMTKEQIITVCLEENHVLSAFLNGRMKEFYTFKKTRFVFQILYNNATTYLRHLRIIDRKSEMIEDRLRVSQRNKELMELLDLEQSLVYFTTSLRGNEMVLEKLLRSSRVKKYPEDEDLLEDVIIENKQAIEMANIYNGILSSMTEGFSSVISNNLNVVMKTMTTVTVVMAIPTTISGIYGMNFVNIPLGNTPYGFVLTVSLTVILTLLVVWLLKKKDFF